MVAAEQFAYQPEALDAPLLIRLRGGREDTTLVGLAVRPAHDLLTDLANAGHLAVGPDAVFYAPFIRDEVIALTSTGDTLWVARRRLPQSTAEPRFEVRDKQVVIDYHRVNLGIARSPDGLVYVLSTPGFTTTESRLDVLDPATGELLRTSRLSTARPTIAADKSGRVYTTFLFVGVNEEKDVEAARSFMDELGFDFPVVLGRGTMRQRFHYPGLPYTVLLDQRGRIAGCWIGFAGEE